MHKRISDALMLFVLVVAACSSGDGTATGPLDGASDAPNTTSTGSDSDVGTNVTVGTDDGAELLFEPRSVSVPAGEEVQLTFANNSTVPHNLTLEEPSGVATSEVVAPGIDETIAFTVADAGDYKFVCTLHPGMEGVLTAS